MLPVIAAKLVAHPLLVYGVARSAMALGLPLARPALVPLAVGSLR